MKIGFARTAVLAGVLSMVATIVAACVTTPDSDRKQLNFLPESQMNSMGISAYSEIKKKEKVSKDKKMTAKIVEIGKRIAKASGRNYKWEFTLFENKAINAFCLPGGKIGVYTGILPIAKTNAGLAAIMGHEVAHATARHGAERMSQQLLLGGTMLAAGVALKDHKNFRGIMAVLGVGAMVGAILPYSRKHESEADAIGLKFMAKAGYNPAEAVTLWQRMAKAGGRQPEIISTHPDPIKRSKALQKMQSKVAADYSRSKKYKTETL